MFLPPWYRRLTTIGVVVLNKPLRRTVLIAYLTLVLLATLAPLSGDMYAAFVTLDKLAHVGLFAGVASLAVLNTTYRWEAALWAVILTSVLAALIELVQGALPFRSAEWWDLWAGILGACIGATLAMAVHRVFQTFLDRGVQRIPER